MVMPALIFCFVCPAMDFVRRLRRAGAVAGRLDRGDELLDWRVRVAVDGRLLGGEVDGRLDAVELVQLLLDPRRTGGTGHAGEVEADLRPRVALCRGRRHRLVPSAAS